MLKVVSTVFGFLMAVAVFSQRQIPLATNFRDLVFQESFTGPAIFPISEKESDFFMKFKDSTKRYSSVGLFLYKRELVEKKDTLTHSRIWITPVLDLMGGIQKNDSLSRVSQNTRGVRMEGQLGRKLFFTTSFFENQAFLPDYAAGYSKSRGEQYYQSADSSYETRNAVISGATRTKPFKNGGFDYAYAIGNISWYIRPKFSLLFGNQPQFIGSGYRSMLWSDNSGGFMNLRANWKLSSKWNVQLMRGRMLNLLRRPYTSNPEAWYEKKSVSWTTVSYSAADWLSLTLFEGGIWSRGDSIHQHNTAALFYVPVPGAASVTALGSNLAFAVSGFDFRARLYGQIVYGQFALSPGFANSSVWQAGMRIHPLRNQLLVVQLEYNHADNQAYTVNNPRISYTGINLPIAHPAGNGLDELVLRINGEYKHVFGNVMVNYYPKQNSNQRNLMPLYSTTLYASNAIVNAQLELGYRFNRTIGLEVYSHFQYRVNMTVSDRQGWFGIGLRTQLNNHYFDF